MGWGVFQGGRVTGVVDDFTNQSRRGERHSSKLEGTLRTMDRSLGPGTNWSHPARDRLSNVI